MNIAELSFLTICFFMVHEFEEIITIKSWIRKNENDKDLSNEMFIKGKSHYSSTETISIMIMEEFVLASIILFVAIKLQVKEIVVGLFIAYTLHLFGHIFQCLKFKKWVPGSRTAVITLLPIFYIFYFVFANDKLDVKSLIIWTVVLLVALLFNLQFLYRGAEKLETWRNKHL